VETLLYRLGHLSARFRWLVLFAWVGLVVLASSFLPSLNSVTSTSNEAFLPSSEPSMQAAALAAPITPTAHPTGTLVFETAQGPPTPAQAEAIVALERSIAKVPDVISVKDVGPSPNQLARLAVVTVSTPASGSATNEVVAAIRASIAKAPQPPGLNAYLTGTIAIAADNAAASSRSQALTNLAGYLVIFLILGLVYRSVVAPFINIIPTGFAIAIAGPLIGQAAHWGLPVSAVTDIMLIVLILGAGTDYGLFLMMRYREEIEGASDRNQAIASAVSKVGEAVVYAALTVSGALFCLYFSNFGIYKGLGPALAIAILVMLAAAMTLVPALLAIMGRAAFWPTKPKSNVDSGWARVAERCARRPGLTLGIGVVILGLLASVALGMSTSGFDSGTAPPSGSQSLLGYEVIQRDFPASVNGPTSFVYSFKGSVWNLKTLTALQATEQDLVRSPLIASVAGPFAPITIQDQSFQPSPAQLLAGYQTWGPPSKLSQTTPAGYSSTEAIAYQLYRGFGQYISDAGTTVQMNTTLHAGSASSNAALNAVPQLRSLASSSAVVAGAERSGLTGFAPAFYDIKNVANQDLLRIFPLVILVIGILLALLLRSLVAPIFLLATVALSYFSTLGITILLFDKLFHQDGVNFILPFLLFIFLVALGEDYNILVMSRIREDWPAGGDHEARTRAVVQAVGQTGATVTSAGIILASTFAIIGVTGSSIEFKEIGVALAIGILLDTFVVRTLLVPSIVQLLGHRTWWPSALSRRAAPPGSLGPVDSSSAALRS
jgi:RND superfamily putative drug exporter